jgi:hypothetical protein
VNGTGLGLSMVQGFVEQSGGTFRIASTLGRGTLVEMRLPAPITTPHRVSSGPVSEPFCNSRILLVDDAADVLIIVGAFLQKAGFIVV